MIFYIKYGCSISHERLIIEAEDKASAEHYAEQAAEEVFWSYDCNYLSEEEYEMYTEDECSEFEYQDMINDIDWFVEVYDENKEEHKETWDEQQGVPYKV